MFFNDHRPHFTYSTVQDACLLYCSFNHGEEAVVWTNRATGISNRLLFLQNVVPYVLRIYLSFSTQWNVRLPKELWFHAFRYAKVSEASGRFVCWWFMLVSRVRRFLYTQIVPILVPACMIYVCSSDCQCNRVTVPKNMTPIPRHTKVNASLCANLPVP